MTHTIHLPGPTGSPLCNRVLSRNTPLTLRNQASMRVSAELENRAMDAGFALNGLKVSKICRHCQRAAGLLPALERKGQSAEHLDTYVQELNKFEFPDAEEEE